MFGWWGGVKVSHWVSSQTDVLDRLLPVPEQLSVTSVRATGTAWPACLPLLARTEGVLAAKLAFCVFRWRLRC